VPDEKALKIRVFRQFLGESDENCQTRLTKSGWVTRFYSSRSCGNCIRDTRSRFGPTTTGGKWAERKRRAKAGRPGNSK